jgi:hypothetical protein
MTGSSYTQAIEEWRREMDAQLRAPGPWGWLAIVGMYPLKTGKNTIGSSPRCDVRLPEGKAPEQLGTLAFDGQHGKLKITAKEPVTVDGVEVRSAALRNHYEPGGMSVVKVRNLSFGIMRSASDPYNIRVWDADSPKRLNFPGRAWYPINPTWRVEGEFMPHPVAYPLALQPDSAHLPELMHIGNVHFAFRDVKYQFAAMRSELGRKYLWLQLRDFTNKATTYAGGRYLQAPLLPENRVDVDFNRLYHPPAAFSEFVTSPVPPAFNRFLLPVEAGERYPA